MQDAITRTIPISTISFMTVDGESVETLYGDYSDEKNLKKYIKSKGVGNCIIKSVDVKHEKRVISLDSFIENSKVAE